MNNKNKVSQKITLNNSLKKTILITSGSVLLISFMAWFLFVYLNFGNSRDAKAQNKNYSSKVSGLWNATTSWNGGSAPPITGLNKDNVTINSGHTITRNGPLSVDNQNSITINGTGKLIIMGDMTVNNDLTLMVNGTLEIYGALSLKNGAKITVNGGGTVTTTGNVNLEQNANFYVDGIVSIGGSLSFGNNASFKGNGQVNVAGSGCSAWTGPGTCNENTALPVELLSFDLFNDGNSVLITWKTATEENNDYFTLERSTDGTTFTPVATIKGNGTTLKISNYEYLDESPLVGRSYYRLTQTDYDGKSETFKPAMIETESNGKVAFSVFPNPFQGSNINVRFNELTSGFITILDANGNQIYQGDIDETQTITNISLKTSVGPGVYYVKIKAKNGSGVAKVIRQ